MRVIKGVVNPYRYPPPRRRQQSRIIMFVALNAFRLGEVGRGEREREREREREEGELVLYCALSLLRVCFPVFSARRRERKVVKG